MDAVDIPNHGQVGLHLPLDEARLRTMSDDNIKRIPTKDIRQEDGAKELTSSPNMEPYLDYLMASMQGADITPHLATLSNLPLEKRYVWRVASALKWGFADFDDVTVLADRDTLSREDFAKVIDLLKFRPIQFCMFLKALVGAEEMKRQMVKAILLAQKEEGGH